MAFLKKGWLQKYEKEKEQLRVQEDKVCHSAMRALQLQCPRHAWGME